MDISLITSVYRAEAHLTAYSRAVLAVAEHVKRAGLSLEVVIVANDAPPPERAQIDALAAQAHVSNAASSAPEAALRVVPLYVPRETLYSSWNRGIQAAQGRCIGFWNVDDVRHPAALIEGARLIAGGCQIVEFPYEIVRVHAQVGRWAQHQRQTYPPQYDPQHFTRKRRLSPFFMVARDLVDTVGLFDGHFKITGDFEWCARPAARAARFCTGQELGGTFNLHGGNLSNSQNPLETVEDAIVMLRHDLWEHLRPVDPDLLRELWFAWGHAGVTLPDDLQDRLWGAGAHAHWLAWQTQRRRAWVRAIPRWIIDHTGLRAPLARLGIVHPAAPRQP